ncbi:MAG: hypothetical protein DDT27_00252 [Dehalococcoidia bacterium]|nr:hypothetical protein [Chloroflexota bacterium]MBT9159462.1 hypothetical protein [Chloroflexota bacterium]MBT9161715.1 hypothetical protein [Chloroflexota bacterium]
MDFFLSLRAKRSNPFVRDCGACSEHNRGISLRVCFGYASQPLVVLAMTWKCDNVKLNIGDLVDLIAAPDSVWYLNANRVSWLPF